MGNSPNQTTIHTGPVGLHQNKTAILQAPLGSYHNKKLIDPSSLNCETVRKHVYRNPSRVLELSVVNFFGDCKARLLLHVPTPYTR